MIPEETPFGAMGVIVTPTIISVMMTGKGLSVGGASADLMPEGLCDDDLPCWWISRVVVRKPERRGTGIGSFMLQRILTEVAKHPSRITLVVVAPGGYNADPDRQYRFYRNNGFRDDPKECELLFWRPL